MFGTVMIVVAYVVWTWIGYEMGIERGRRMEQTKRGIRRGEPL